MITFKTYLHLVQADDVALLPTDGELLFLDFETTSRDRNLESTNPHHHCWPIGFAYSLDQDPHVYFVPWKLVTQEFIHKLFAGKRKWINHHIKYDAHVLLNSGVMHIDDLVCDLVCTIAMARLIDSDRSYKGGYGLDALVRDWCGRNMLATYNRILPYLVNNKDYGRIPLDIIAEYACGDVVENRILYFKEMENMPEDSLDVMCTEIALTKVLLRIEQVGLKLDLPKVKLAEFFAVSMMLEIQNKINDLVGYFVLPTSPADCRDLIVHRFGQPVLKWTNLDENGKETAKSNPSFDTPTLKEYLMRLDLPPLLREVITLMIAYRKESQHNGLFYKPWQVLHVDSILHSNYNQNVRTGRMSCSQPNNQQLDKLVKRLIIPKPGYVFLSFDYSQIEYRLIVHYINDKTAIRAFNEDPTTDFHQYVAEMCGVDRSNGKTLNFAMGFGMGKAKTQARLQRNFAEAGVEMTNEQIVRKAAHVYEQYHKSLPNLKPRSREAADIARRRGYVKSIAGRRIRLPGPIHNRQVKKNGELVDRTHIAFNRVVQPSASDMAKERAVAMQPLLRELRGELVALVHDEFLIEVPDGPDESIFARAELIRAKIEDSPYKMSVPLLADAKFSRESWGKLNKIPRISKIVA